MFAKSKNMEEQFVIAVKDVEATKKALDENAINLPYDKSIYKELFSTCDTLVEDKKALNKFIRTLKMKKGEVKHYWEGLIDDGYTILKVAYNKKTPSIQHLCSNNTIKFICEV